ncbi:TIGR02285 family protein [Pseudomonas sp. 15FMM2]|uniref:TIGR02285 family protein n=1 Tax=Pseudomonas imrae TaxID=2992837 RepID=A0ACC7PDM9_9PSED
MVRSFKKRLAHRGCIAVLLGALAPVSQAEEMLTWVVRDLPPMTIFEGSQKNRGTIDQLLPLLIERLPQYRHQTLHLNRARSMQMLTSPTFTCDPSLVWTPTRAKSIVFSRQTFAVLSNGVTIRQKQQEALAQFVLEGTFDLEKFLHAEQTRLGVVAERSYGSAIDEHLSHAPPHKLSPHHGNDALGSLLQMQRMGRLEAVLGYLTEVRYHAQQQDIDPDELVFYPVSGAPRYQRIHIGCSDTAQGREAIAHIDQALQDIPTAPLLQSYASWLDPALGQQYLKDNPLFFDNAPEQ